MGEKKKRRVDYLFENKWQRFLFEISEYISAISISSWSDHAIEYPDVYIFENNSLSFRTVKIPWLTKSDRLIMPVTPSSNVIEIK